MKLVKEMTDLELTLHLIELGVEEAKGLLETYNRRGRYDGKNSLNSLHKLALTVYESHELKINPKSKGGNKPYGGSKPRNILGALRNEVIAKQDGRVENEGQPTSDEQVTMTQHIFNQLLDMYQADAYMDFSLKGWTEQLELIDVEGIPTLRFERHIRDVYEWTNVERINPTQAVQAFKSDTIYNRNKQVVESAFKSLKKSGLIRYEIYYNKIDLNGERKILEIHKYKEIKDARKQLLDELGVSMSAYNRAIGNPNAYKPMEDVRKQLDELLETFDAKIIYESYNIVEVSTNERYDVAKDDFMDAYWSRLITLTESRQKRYDKNPIHEQGWFVSVK